MEKETQSSSLNLLLIISAVVLVGLGVTWWGFDHFRPEQQTSTPIIAVAEPPQTVQEVAFEAVSGDGLDDHLSKAKLAIEANMIAEPAGHNALYFIGLVLGETPNHPEANEALDSIADNLTNTVRVALEASDFSRAHKIAETLDTLRPNHQLVFEVREALQRHVDGMFAAAWTHADNGERSQALALVSEAAELPGVDADRLVAMQTEVDSRHDKFTAAAAARQQRSNDEEAAASAVAEWLSNAEAALESGQFTEPAGDNAAFYLAKVDSDDPAAIAFEERMRGAVLEAAELGTREGRFADVEALLGTAAQLGVSAEDIDIGRLALDRAYAIDEATKVIPTGELVWRERVAPVYPRSAERRGTEGEVQIVFTVTTSGETADVEVVSSDPTNVFDRAAIQAVQQWEFEPHVIRGITVNQRSGALLRFSLQ